MNNTKEKKNTNLQCNQPAAPSPSKVSFDLSSSPSFHLPCIHSSILPSFPLLFSLHFFHRIACLSTMGRKTDALLKGLRSAKTSVECLTLLKLSIQRIKVMRNKRSLASGKLRGEIAKLIQSGQDAQVYITKADILIKEENLIAAYDLLGQFCQSIIVRFPVIETQRNLPIDMKEPIASLIYAAPRCIELEELKQIKSIFTGKYGKDFAAAVAELRPDSGVNREIIEKLSVSPATSEAKLKLMKEICLEHKIEWTPGEAISGFSNSTLDKPQSSRTSNQSEVQNVEATRIGGKVVAQQSMESTASRKNNNIVDFSRKEEGTHSLNSSGPSSSRASIQKPLQKDSSSPQVFLHAPSHGVPKPKTQPSTSISSTQMQPNQRPLQKETSSPPVVIHVPSRGATKTTTTEPSISFSRTPTQPDHSELHASQLEADDLKDMSHIESSEEEDYVNDHTHELLEVKRDEDFHEIGNAGAETETPRESENDPQSSTKRQSSTMKQPAEEKPFIRNNVSMQVGKSFKSGLGNSPEVSENTEMTRTNLKEEVASEFQDNEEMNNRSSRIGRTDFAEADWQHTSFSAHQLGVLQKASSSSSSLVMEEMNVEDKQKTPSPSHLLVQKNEMMGYGSSRFGEMPPLEADSEVSASAEQPSENTMSSSYTSLEMAVNLQESLSTNTLANKEMNDPSPSSGVSVISEHVMAAAAEAARLAFIEYCKQYGLPSPTSTDLDKVAKLMPEKKAYESDINIDPGQEDRAEKETGKWEAGEKIELASAVAQPPPSSKLEDDKENSSSVKTLMEDNINPFAESKTNGSTSEEDEVTENGSGYRWDDDGSTTQHMHPSVEDEYLNTIFLRHSHSMPKFDDEYRASSVLEVKSIFDVGTNEQGRSNSYDGRRNSYDPMYRGSSGSGKQLELREEEEASSESQAIPVYDNEYVASSSRKFFSEDSVAFHRGHSSRQFDGHNKIEESSSRSTISQEISQPFTEETNFDGSHNNLDGSHNTGGSFKSNSLPAFDVAAHEPLEESLEGRGVLFDDGSPVLNEEPEPRDMYTSASYDEDLDLSSRAHGSMFRKNMTASPSSADPSSYGKWATGSRRDSRLSHGDEEKPRATRLPTNLREEADYFTYGDRMMRKNESIKPARLSDKQPDEELLPPGDDMVTIRGKTAAGSGTPVRRTTPTTTHFASPHHVMQTENLDREPNYGRDIPGSRDRIQRWDDEQESSVVTVSPMSRRTKKSSINTTPHSHHQQIMRQESGSDYNTTMMKRPERNSKQPEFVASVMTAREKTRRVKEGNPATWGGTDELVVGGSKSPDRHQKVDGQPSSSSSEDDAHELLRREGSQAWHGGEGRIRRKDENNNKKKIDPPRWRSSVSSIVAEEEDDDIFEAPVSPHQPYRRHQDDVEAPSVKKPGYGSPAAAHKVPSGRPSSSSHPKTPGPPPDRPSDELQDLEEDHHVDSIPSSNPPPALWKRRQPQQQQDDEQKNEMPVIRTGPLQRRASTSSQAAAGAAPQESERRIPSPRRRPYPSMEEDEEVPASASTARKQKLVTAAAAVDAAVAPEERQSMVGAGKPAGLQRIVGGDMVEEEEEEEEEVDPVLLATIPPPKGGGEKGGKSKMVVKAKSVAAEAPAPAPAPAPVPMPMPTPTPTPSKAPQAPASASAPAPVPTPSKAPNVDELWANFLALEQSRRGNNVPQS